MDLIRCHFCGTPKQYFYHDRCPRCSPPTYSVVYMTRPMLWKQLKQQSLEHDPRTFEDNLQYAVNWHLHSTLSTLSDTHLDDEAKEIYNRILSWNN